MTSRKRLTHPEFLKVFAEGKYGAVIVMTVQ